MERNTASTETWFRARRGKKIKNLVSGKIKPFGRPQMALSIRVFHKWHFVKEKKCNTSTHPSGVYINQIWKNFFPKTSLEGLTTWSKMVKIDQNRRGGGMAVAWSFNSYQIVISSNTDCVSELWAEKKTCRQRRTTWWRARRRWPRPRLSLRN